MKTKPKRILFIVPHRLHRSPGQRFRCEQYLAYLHQNGIQYSYSNIINKSDDRVFYSPGNYPGKILIVVKAVFIRIYDVLRAHRYDAVFIYREAFMLGTVVFEHLLKWSGKPIVFDFDDAIWLNDVSEGNKNLSWLKNPSKTDHIIRHSSLIFAGNSYLAQHARMFNPQVVVIPTTIDTNYHHPSRKIKKPDDKICIGWTGTSTTLKHFQKAIPFLLQIKEKYGQKVYFKVIVDCDFKVPELELQSHRWKLDTEIEDLSEFDMGIMPLPNDDWSKGKCGFKGLQYMSLEIPCIMSPVGVNSEIIQDGQNGFLAAGDQEWVEKMSLLIENPALREKLGKNGRKTIEEKYSVESQKGYYLENLQKIMGF